MLCREVTTDCAMKQQSIPAAEVTGGMSVSLSLDGVSVMAASLQLAKEENSLLFPEHHTLMMVQEGNAHLTSLKKTGQPCPKSRQFVFLSAGRKISAAMAIRQAIETATTKSGKALPMETTRMPKAAINQPTTVRIALEKRHNCSLCSLAK